MGIQVRLPGIVTEPEIEDLGTEAFTRTHQKMKALAEDVHHGHSEGKILLVEHPPVHTAGRATPQEELREGVVPIERGGRTTFHGPGQLVIYPILRLPKRDVHAWLRTLENYTIAICVEFGLTGEASVDGTGVFVDTKKVASIGVAIRHWINLHGVAINVDMDLAGFFEISPCGLEPTTMTDLSRAAGRPITMNSAKQAARLHSPILSTGH